MELQLVNFEQAKALEKLGLPHLDHEGFCYKTDGTLTQPIYTGEWCNTFAPVLELVAKWLRDEKFIDISIKVDSHGKNNIPRQYATEIINANKMVGQNSERFVLCVPNGGCISYNSYEEALSAGIDKAIEILKGI